MLASLWDTSSRGQGWFRCLCPCRIPHMPGLRCNSSARYHARSGRESSYVPYFRRRPPGRLLPHAGRLPAFHDETEASRQPPLADDAFGPIWCAWGYGRSVQPQQVFDTLPTVKRLGFVWVTLDDGWQNNVGDWALDPKKFPRGDADIKALVDRIHQEGFRGTALVVSAQRCAELGTSEGSSRLRVTESRWFETEKFPGGTPTISARRTAASWSTTRHWCERFWWIGDLTA